MVRLATRGGAGIVVTLVVLFLGAVVVVVGRRVGAWRLPPPPPQDIERPDARWGQNDTPGTRGGPEGTDGG